MKISSDETEGLLSTTTKHVLEKSAPTKINDSASYLTNSKARKGFRETKWRWLTLALSSVALVGSYFCYDNPEALQTQIQDKLDLNSFKYNLLYSVYSFPNIVLPFFGGVFIDRIGARSGFVLFSFLLVIGQTLFAIGGAKQEYWLMILGRLVFGFGGESLSVTQSTLISEWFRGKELAFAMGLNISVSRLGSVMNNGVLPALYDSTNSLAVPFFVGAGICLISWFCTVGMFFLDRHADRTDLAMNIEKVKQDPVRCRDIKTFKLAFWLLTVNCLFVYMAVFPFNNIANNFFQENYHFSKSTAAGLYFALHWVFR